MNDIMGGVNLNDFECIVFLDEAGAGWIAARSDWIVEHDILMECSTEDNGFNSSWDKDLCVGVYLLRIKPWSHYDSWAGEWDAGVDVEAVTPLWSVRDFQRP